MAAAGSAGSERSDIDHHSDSERTVASDDPGSSGEDTEADDEEEEEIDPMGVSLTGGAAPDVSHPCSDRLMVINDKAEWVLSGAKPGNGIECLLDGDLETYWQSDGGGIPHTITVRFYQRETVLGVALYVDFTKDDSYTPKFVSFLAGHLPFNMRVIRDVELTEPVGWVWVPLGEMSKDRGGFVKPLRPHTMQIQIKSMHAGGRDTHLRQVCLFGPRPVRLELPGSGGGDGLLGGAPLSASMGAGLVLR